MALNDEILWISCAAEGTQGRCGEGTGIDAKELFVNYFILPALQADAIYEGQYPLATALSRPLMAKLLVDVAPEEKP